MLNPSFHGVLVFSFAFLAIYGWYSIVYKEVPEPYLDEEFHIPQAQAYLDGKWREWDPKLTTPPGLYIVSWLLIKPAQLLGVDSAKEGRDLRIVNVLGALCLYKVLRVTIKHLRANERNQEPNENDSKNEIRHDVLNILLFPVLFFFYALYYTDILSVLSVMITYLCHLERLPSLVFISGLVSLSFRQTNVFWVALYLGALELERQLRKVPSSDKCMTVMDAVKASWESGDVFDPLIDKAKFEDYIKTAISYLTASTRKATSVYFNLWPYVTLFSTFVLFVLWNGGVVLGDKSNHIASIHLAQMLYLWPYFVFFSLPLLLLSFLISTTQLLRRPRPAIILPVLIVMGLVIYFNTIIHPFTLADNRHYVFYVFRILRRHPAIKYLAAPIYLLCAVVTLRALESSSAEELATKMEEDSSQIIRKSSDDSVSAAKSKSAGLRVSWVLIWLFTTTLNLCFAPLVEPRYCIIPWIMWRIHLPSSSKVAGRGLSGGNFGYLIEHRLWLETLWFLAINAVTGYMFLYRGFRWEQEPGKIQRFMW